MCIVCFAHIFHSVCYSVIFLNCRQIWIPDKLQSNADFKTTTVKAATDMDLGHGQYHVFSIAFDFSFVYLWCLGSFMMVDLDVCEMSCVDFIAKRIAITKCHCIFSFVHIFFFFMLRHCQAKERMVCAYAFASKQFKYVHEARLNTLNEVVKRMYGICVAMPFVSGGWKRYQRQKRTLNKWLETNDIHYLISSFGLRFYFSLSRIVIQYQKPKRRKINSTERRTISIGCDRLSLCVTSSTHFSHIYLHRQEQFDNAIASIQSIKL